MERKNCFEVNFKKKGGEIMKKLVLLTALVVLFAAPAMAGIYDSKHNLGDNAGSGKSTTANIGMTEVCIFCHAPHNPKQNQPLWNRNDGTATVTFYTSAVSGRTIVQAESGSAFSSKSVSKFCLSCHDGSLGMWAGVYNKFSKTDGGNAGGYGGAGNMITALAIGGDSDGLANDHPVNISYTDSLADTVNHTELNATGTAEAAGIRFFIDDSATSGGTDKLVECASCHDPHKTVNTKFLRTTNAGSALCLACHNK